MKSDDKLICAFVESVVVGQRFEDWPLHITIVPWFKIVSSEEDFFSCIEQSMQDQKPFMSKVGKEKRFAAWQFNMLINDEWKLLHERSLKCVNKNARSTAPLRFIGRYYRPHVTAQKNKRLYAGDIFTCNRLSVVEQKGAYHEVVREVYLGE